MSVSVRTEILPKGLKRKLATLKKTNFNLNFQDNLNWKEQFNLLLLIELLNLNQFLQKSHI